MKHAQGMEADLGGTELLNPLQHIFGMEPRSGYARQIFVLTDGSVSNTDACIQEMKNNIKHARCFTFGIGSGASSALVEGLAKAGNGTAEFMKEGERMQPIVIRSLKRALQPAITDVSVTFEIPQECEVLPSPSNLPPIFNGEKLVSYAVLKPKKASKGTVDCMAILKGNTLGGKQEYMIPFTLDSSSTAPSLPVIHHLTAKALIADWEIENKEKKSIIELSIESSVVSSHTAFIAIDEESAEPVAGSMKTYDILAEHITLLDSFLCSTTDLGATGSREGNGGGLPMSSNALRKKASSVYFHGASGGLVSIGNDWYLPLKSVSVDAQIRGFVLGLQSTLTYSNNSPIPVEVLFHFPVEKSHAVVGLTVVIDGCKITADLREKEEARAQYDDAIAGGHSAALAEEKSGDVFSIALGNLPPGKDAEIRLKLVGELGIDAEGATRFSLPSILKPRYTPEGSTDPLLDTVPSGEGQQVEISRVSAVSWFHMTVEEADSIAEVTSPTHPVSVTPNDSNQLDVHLLKELDSDLVIQVKMKEPHTPKALVEGCVDKKGQFMSNPAVMLNFFPTFPSIEAACEFIFLVDRSGSMRGSFIKSARETLALFLKSIPEGNYFNIIGFGSCHTSLFQNSVPYDEKHLEEAMKHVQGMEADLGGTELLRPLQHIFGMKPRSGYARQIFVLTDGSVSNTGACIQEMKNNIKHARCFTFGIGSGASSALVEDLAKAGNGTAEFMKEGERMQPIVIRSLKRALQPAITDVSVTFEIPKECEVLPSPSNLPPIFNGEKLVSYAVLKPKKASKGTVNCMAILKGNMLGGKQEYMIPFTFDSSSTAPSLPVIHHLAAKALIADWEIENKEKKSITELSIESSVVSSHTAFIAIYEESAEPVAGSMKTYDILAEHIALLESFPCSTAVLRAAGSREGNGGGLPIPSNAQEKISSSVSSQRALFKRSGLTKKISRTSSFLSCSWDSVSVNHLGLEYECVCSSSLPSSPAHETGYIDLIPPPLYNNLEPASVTDILPELEIDSMYAAPRQAPHSSALLLPRFPTASETLSSDLILSPPVQSSVSSVTDILLDLITAQQVNGSWALTHSFAQLVGKPLAELEAACPIESKGEGATVWATVLAVTLLRVRYSSQQDEWELMVMKAESWLKKQTLPSDSGLEELFQAAHKLF